MVKCCVALAFICLVGCNVSKELNVVKITESSNGKTVVVPKGHRLSVSVQGKWYTSVEASINPPAGRPILLGVDRGEQFVNGKITQFIVVHFAIHNSGELSFAYHFTDNSVKEFKVKVIQEN